MLCVWTETRKNFENIEKRNWIPKKIPAEARSIYRLIGELRLRYKVTSAVKAHGMLNRTHRRAHARGRSKASTSRTSLLEAMTKTPGVVIRRKNSREGASVENENLRKRKRSRCDPKQKSKQQRAKLNNLKYRTIRQTKFYSRDGRMRKVKEKPNLRYPRG